MQVRNPNTGPYVVTWYDDSGVKQAEEHHTWSLATYRMRQLLIEGRKQVSVSFV